MKERQLDAKQVEARIANKVEELVGENISKEQVALKLSAAQFTALRNSFIGISNLALSVSGNCDGDFRSTSDCGCLLGSSFNFKNGLTGPGRSYDQRVRIFPIDYEYARVHTQVENFKNCIMMPNSRIQK